MHEQNGMISAHRIARRLIACARVLVAANLTQKQRDLINQFLKKRREGLDFGDVIPWNSEGRAYFPVTRTISDIQAPFEIVHALRLLGYSISSYRDGYAVKTIEVRDGKKTQRKGIGKILKNEVHDESLYKWFMNRLGTSNKSDKRQFLVCITHNPEDVGAMSTNRNWTSCMELPSEENELGGAFYDTALRQVQYGGMCAYLIDPEDKSVDRPYARIAIKRLENKDGTRFIYKMEMVRIYGDEELAEECNMMDVVADVLNKSNEKTRQGGGFLFKTVDPDSYSDSNISSMFYFDDPNDVLTLSTSEFNEYALSKSNMFNMDDTYCKAVLTYISRPGYRKEKANGMLHYIYEYIKPSNRMKFLEYFMDIIDFRMFSMTRELPIEFIRKHPDRIHWPSILSHCGEEKDSFKIWYSYGDLEQFSDRIEKAGVDIENGKSIMTQQRMEEITDSAIDIVNSSRFPFLSKFTANKNFSSYDNIIMSHITLSNVTTLKYVIEHNGPDEMFGNEIYHEKKGAAHSIWSYFGDDKELKKKSEDQIIAMAENGGLDKEQALYYAKFLNRNLSQKTYRPFIELQIGFDLKNATMSFSHKAYSPFIDKEVKMNMLYGDTKAFNYDEDILAVISETVKKIFDWMIP